MYIFCSNALSDTLKIKKKELQKISIKNVRKFFRKSKIQTMSIKKENKELQMAKHNLERFLNQQEEEQKGKRKTA